MEKFEYAIDFFNSLVPSDQFAILEAASKHLGKRKISSFEGDREVKQHLWLLERIKKFLDGEDYGGYDCDIHDCGKPAKFYNGNVDAFYCLEHN